LSDRASNELAIIDPISIVLIRAAPAGRVYLLRKCPEFFAHLVWAERRYQGSVQSALSRPLNGIPELANRSRDRTHEDRWPLGRCHLERDGDAANVVLSAVGHNLRLVLAWQRILLRLILLALWRAFAAAPTIKLAS
jgi:hypothetical protein